MRRRHVVIVGALIAALVTVALAAQAFGASTIRLVVNGQEIKPDVAPRLIDGRAMVPVRWVAEALGSEVRWDAQNRSVIVNQPPDVWSDTLDTQVINPMKWVEVRSLLSRFYLAWEWHDYEGFKQLVTDDFPQTFLPGIGGHYPNLMDWQIQDGRMVDEDHLQLRVYEIYEYYGRELYAYVDDVTVDLRQLKVSRVDSVGGRLELSSVTLFNGLTFTNPEEAGP